MVTTQSMQKKQNEVVQCTELRRKEAQQHVLAKVLRMEVGNALGKECTIMCARLKNLAFHLLERGSNRFQMG